MIRDLVDYYYYRIAQFYITHDAKKMKFYDTRSGGAIAFSFFGNLFCALVLCPLSSVVGFDFIGHPLLRWSKSSVGVMVVMAFCVWGYFYGTQERYDALCEKFADEPHRKLRGWCVFGFSVAVFIILIISVRIFLVR